MKLNKTMLAIALGLSAVSLSQAETIYLTGSSALRSSIYAVLSNGSALFSTTPCFYRLRQLKGGGDTYMAFYGPL